MLGAIVGDIVGSLRENSNVLSKEFELFPRGSTYTDDTVMTMAVCEWLLEGGGISQHLRAFFHRYPDAGYGAGFRQWVLSDPAINGTSYGNGSAMRVSPVAYAHEDLASVLNSARASAIASHSHPEGIKGAESIAAATFLARHIKDKEQIRSEVKKLCDYPLDFTMGEVKVVAAGIYNPTCQWSCPLALTAFFESHSFEDAIRNAISLGGDSDTIAAMAGGIAASYYGIPEDIQLCTKGLLPWEFRELLERFESRFPSAKNLLIQGAT